MHIRPRAMSERGRALLDAATSVAVEQHKETGQPHIVHAYINKSGHIYYEIYSQWDNASLFGAKHFAAETYKYGDDHKGIGLIVNSSFEPEEVE